MSEATNSVEINTEPAEVMEVELPLFPESDYHYYAPLQGNSYEVRIYYNERVEWWAIDIRNSDGTPVILGQRLVVNHPILLNYVFEDLTGALWLEPRGRYQNQTLKHPLELHKYYRLFYVYESE